jgi:hypothetical protein
MPAWEAYKKNPEDPATKKAYLDAIEKGNGLLYTLTNFTELAGKYSERENGKAKRDRMQSEWNLFHTTAFTDPNHPYFVYGPVDSFGFMGKYATEEAARAARGEPSELFTPGGTNTEAAKATDTNTESKNVSQTVRVPKEPEQAPPSGEGAASSFGEGAASSSGTPTATPVGTPTAQPGVLAPRPKVTPAVPATPVKPVVPTAPAPVPAPQAKAIPPTPIDGKLEARLRELKQVTKRGNLSSEQRAEVAEYLKDPNVKRIWDTMSVPSARPVTPATPTTPAPTATTAKPSMTPEQAQAEIARLVEKVKGGWKLSKEEGARVQELKKILGK